MQGSYNIAGWLCNCPSLFPDLLDKPSRLLVGGSGRMMAVWLIITSSQRYILPPSFLIHIKPLVFNIQNRRHFDWCVYFKSFLGGVRRKDTFQFLVKWKIIPWYIHGYDLWSVFFGCEYKDSLFRLWSKLFHTFIHSICLGGGCLLSWQYLNWF